MVEPSQAVLDWAVGVVGDGAGVVEVTGLREGSNPWLVRIEHDGRVTDVVLKTANPSHSAGFATEVAALRLAAGLGIAAPRILGLDADGSRAGIRAVLETVVPGRSTIPVRPSPERLRVMGASVAALRDVTVPHDVVGRDGVAVGGSPELPLRTHPIPVSDFPRDRLRGAGHTTPLLGEGDERVGRLTPPAGPIGFVHGDLWQGNLLWQDDTLTGIIDWDMAGVGQHGIDLCSLRLDAALMFGSDADGQVLAGWTATTGEQAPDLAYWDAVAALNMPGDMAVFLATIHDQGRTDLTADLLNERRDTFLRDALDRLALA